MKCFGVVVVAIAAAVCGDGGLVRPCLAVSSSSSLWHAFDGLPILLARPNNRRKSNNHSSAVIHTDSVGHVDALHSTSSRVDRELQLPVDAKGELTNFTWDTTFNCPATVFCHPVCVATAADCPDDAVCPAGTEVCL